MIDKLQVLFGVGIASSPLWAEVFSYVHTIASTIAVVCGAVIGIFAVIRLIRGKRPRRVSILYDGTQDDGESPTEKEKPL